MDYDIIRPIFDGSMIDSLIRFFLEPEDNNIKIMLAIFIFLFYIKMKNISKKNKESKNNKEEDE